MTWAASGIQLLPLCHHHDPKRGEGTAPSLRSCFRLEKLMGMLLFRVKQVHPGQGMAGETLVIALSC